VLDIGSPLADAVENDFLETADDFSARFYQNVTSARSLNNNNNNSIRVIVSEMTTAQAPQEIRGKND